MDQQGWIKLHRRLLTSQIFKNKSLLQVWIWCLLKANHNGKFVSMKIGKGFTQIRLDPGQFVFGRHSAARELGEQPTSVYRNMQKLKNMGNCDIQSNNHYSIITIINWDTYQNSMPIKGTTNVTTNVTANMTANEQLTEHKQEEKKYYTIYKEQANAQANAWILPNNNSNHYAAKLSPDIVEQLKNVCKDLDKSLKTKTVNGTKFNPHQFLQTYIKQNYHPKAVLDVLTYMSLNIQSIINPWAYAKSAISKASQNYNEIESINACNYYKKLLLEVKM